MIDCHERSRLLTHNVLAHESLIVARLRRMYVYGLEVEDIVQEVYARLFALPSFDTIKFPRQYAMQIATSIIIDHVRRTRIVPITSTGDLDRLDVMSPEAGPDRHLESREEVAEIERHLARLPATTREILVLRRVEGLSQKE